VNVNVKFRGKFDVNLGCDRASFFDFSVPFTSERARHADCAGRVRRPTGRPVPGRRPRRLGRRGLRSVGTEPLAAHDTVAGRDRHATGIDGDDGSPRPHPAGSSVRRGS